MSLADSHTVMLQHVSRPKALQHGWVVSKPRRGVWRPSVSSSQKHAGPAAQVGVVDPTAQIGTALPQTQQQTTATLPASLTRLRRPLHHGSVQLQLLRLIQQTSTVAALAHLFQSQHSQFKAAGLAAAAEHLLCMYNRDTSATQQGAAAPSTTSTAAAATAAAELSAALAAAAAEEHLASCTAQQLVSILRCVAVLGGPVPAPTLEHLFSVLVFDRLPGELNRLLDSRRAQQTQQQQQQRQQQDGQQHVRQQTPTQQQQQQQLGPHPRQQAWPVVTTAAATSVQAGIMQQQQQVRDGREPQQQQQQQQQGVGYHVVVQAYPMELWQQQPQQPGVVPSGLPLSSWQQQQQPQPQQLLSQGSRGYMGSSPPDALVPSTTRSSSRAGYSAHHFPTPAAAAAGGGGGGGGSSSSLLGDPGLKEGLRRQQEGGAGAGHWQLARDPPLQHNAVPFHPRPVGGTSWDCSPPQQVEEWGWQQEEAPPQHPSQQQQQQQQWRHQGQQQQQWRHQGQQQEEEAVKAVPAVGGTSAAAAAGRTTHNLTVAESAVATQVNSTSGPATIGQMLSQTAWAATRLGLTRRACWSELASLTGVYLRQLSAHDAVLVVHALAKAGHLDPHLMAALQQHLRPWLHQLSPKALTALLAACAKAQHYHPGFLAAVAASAAACMERFSVEQLAHSLWACARLRFADARMLSALCVQVLACLPQASPTAAARIAWALGALKVQEPALVSALVERASAAGMGLSMQSIAMLAWSLAKQQQAEEQQMPGAAMVPSSPSSSAAAAAGAGVPSTSRDIGRGRQASPAKALQARHRLMAALCDSAVTQLSGAPARCLCVLLWAAAVLRCRHRRLLAAAGTQLQAAVAQCDAVDIAQAVWAFARLGYHHNTAVAVLVQGALRQLPSFGCQALGMMAWGATQLTMPSGTAKMLGAALEQQARVLLPQLAPRDVAILLWATQELGWQPGQLLHACAAALPRLLQGRAATPQDVCNIAVTARRAGATNAELLGPLAAAAAARAGEFGPQGVTNMVWAYAGCRWLQEELLNAFEARAAAMVLQHFQQQQQQEQEEGSLSPVTPRSPAAAPGGGRSRQAPQGWQQQVAAPAGASREDVLGCRAVASLLQGLAQLQGPLLQLVAAVAAHQEPILTAAAAAAAGGKGGTLGAGKEHGKQQQAGRLKGHPKALLPPLHLSHWTADALCLLVWSATACGAHRQQQGLVVSALQRLEVLGLEGVGRLHMAQLHLALMRLQLEGCLEMAPAPPAPSAAASARQDSHTTSSYSSYSSGSSVLLAGGDGEACHELSSRGGPHRSWPIACPQVAMLCCAAWTAARRAQHLGGVQEQVVVALRQLQLSPQVQTWVASQQLRVEVWVQHAGHQVALDVVPSQQVTSSHPRRLMGSAVLQQACWRLAGFKVATLFAEDWQQPRSDKERRALLQSALDAAVAEE